MNTQFKCSYCGANGETNLVEKDGKNPMALTICSKCGCSLKVVQLGNEISVETMPDNP